MKRLEGLSKDVPPGYWLRELLSVRVLAAAIAARPPPAPPRPVGRPRL